MVVPSMPQLPDPKLPDPTGKTPRTERGRRTLRLLLDAATGEFGERGYHDAAIARIAQRAGVAIGSFYTYFDSKEAVFAALVGDMSGRVRDHVAPAIVDARDGLDGEQLALEAYLGFVKDHKEVYRIIDEAEFVDAASYRQHYESTAKRLQARLEAGSARGELRDDIGEVEAWAMMGMNVFLGLRYGVLSEDGDPADIAAKASRLLGSGLKA